jgi:cellulose synthase/poly-beta-1,6-N-acetylglucosamine synthase-like glycosyltransferase
MAGYPLLLWKWPFPSRPVDKRSDFLPSVSLLLAVHNGASFLRDKLNSILALSYPPEKLEVFILSDGSSDATDSIAKEFASPRIHLISLPRGGKSAAINHGLSLAQGEILFFTDVRQRLDPLALRHLAANFADPKVGAVTGELQILAPNGAVGEQADMDLYWRYELWARAKQSAHFSLFNTTGCLYAMRRSLARPLPPNTLIDDAEMPLQAYLKGYRIIFDPVSIAFDYPTQSGTEWTRRMRTLGGLWQVFLRHPKLLLWPHPMWLHFVSHKFGRLALPWCLIGIFTSTALLPDTPVRSLLIANEILFLLLAASLPWLPARSPLYRYASWARTFLVMNLAAFLSLKVFFVNPQRMWLTTRVDQNKNHS